VKIKTSLARRLRWLYLPIPWSG